MQRTPGHSHEKIRGSSRRQLLLTSGALAALAIVGLPAPASALTGDQDAWRFCSKCASMFFDGSGDKGACAAGGTHVAEGFLFSLHYDDAPSGSDPAQYEWRFCIKCASLFYDGARTKGRCPAGAAHDAQGFDFGLNHDAQVPASTQSDWRFCDKCFALFWNGAASKGRCAAGAAHHAQGFVFNVPNKPPAFDSSAAVSEALAALIGPMAKPIQDYCVSKLGAGDLIAPGVTLYDMDMRLGTPNFQSSGPDFNYRLIDNYLYCKSTTPGPAGSYGDPAFEVHCNASLVGSIRVAGRRVRIENTVASVPSFTVRPRNVTGALVTTVAYFFQETAYGGRVMREAFDRYLRVDLTNRVNTYLQRLD